MVQYKVEGIKKERPAEVTLECLCSMLERMPGNYMVFQMDLADVEYLYYTRGVPALSGHTVEEYERIESPYELILDEDRVLIQGKIQEYIERGGTTQQEELVETDLLFRMFHKDKGFIWVHMKVKKYGVLNHHSYYIANLLDVTKETLISYAMMEASDRYICVIEKATKRFLYANQGFYDLIDSNPAEAMGKHCYELLCKVLEMKDNDNCMCYSSINAEPPLEMYNPEKEKYLTLTGREIVWGEYNAYVFYMSDITEKKRKDEQLEDSRKRFNVALDNSELMIWEYDIVNHRCINSEKAGRDYNIPLIIENYPESLFETGYTPPETVAQIKEVQRRLLNGETGFSVERRTIDKFGKSNWQKVEYTLECDENGKPLRAIVCGLDITARKELELKYEEQMEYRNKFAENAMFSSRLDLDSDKVLDYTCTEPMLEDMAAHARNASAFLQQFFTTSIFDPESGLTKEKLTLEALRETYALGQSQYQTTYRCSLLNLYLDLNLTMYKNPGNGHLEVFYVVRDATENILKQSALQSVVKKDYDFVAAIDTATGNMRFLAYSKYAVMPEYSREKPNNYDTIMLNFAHAHRAIYYSEEDYRAASEGILLQAVLEKLEKMPVYEFNCKTKDAQGTIHTFRLSYSYSDVSRKQIVFTRANITQVVQEERSVQLKLENALKDAKKADQAKTDFLSRMSHDMRTPMNGIIGMTQLTQDLPDLSSEAQGNLAAIRDSSAYLLQLINDTLDMNKIESNRFTLKPEAVLAEDLISHIIAAVLPMAEKKQITVDYVPINVQSKYILADRVRLQQLFLNLMSNAVKFTQEGGYVRLIVECLKMENHISYDRVVVEDNGRGMTEEFLKHIFEPFSQERNEIVSGQEGTGLGMAIVKNLVEQMGGRIEIESTQGKGTKVIVYLNFQSVDPKYKKEGAVSQNIAELKGKCVLLVEDHPLNATITKRLLEKKGMKIEHAIHGKQGVEMFAQAPENYYDVILMDIRMPEMNGMEAARTIRKMKRQDAAEIPIIAMTANAYDEDVRQALDAGMNAHLGKPVEPETMYSMIQEMLKQRVG